jgi:hypothetical protein
LTAQYLQGSLDASLYVADFDLIQAPSVSSIHISGSSPNNGSSEQFTVTFSESVTGVDLTDFATHVTGNVADTNISVSGSGATYTVTVNGVTGDGTLRLDLNGSGTGIKDAAGNAIATGFTAGDVYTIDHTAPAVTSVSVPANATYVAGQHLDFTVNLSEAVTVTGTPEIALTLDTGGTVDAQYISGGGTSVLTFRYTVIGGEADLNGVSLGGAIILNGGTVKDAATNDAAPTLHNVADTSGVLVDSIPPPTALSINTVDSSPNNLNIEHFTVTFSNAVNGVDASDFTLVTSGTASGSIAAVSGSGTTWTVTVDNVTGDGTLRLDLNNTGDAITDNFGNTLTAAHTGDQSYTIDHTAPTETSVTAVADNGLADVGTGHVVTITLDTSEVVNVTGTPTLMLSDGGIATYTGGTGSNALTFSYTVVKGDNASDLHVTGYNGTIQDAAGNGLAPVSGDLALQIDGTAPAAPTVALLHDNGISATDHITNDPSLVFSTLALGDTFLFKVDGGSFSATAPDFTTSPLADGLHTVSVEEVDAVGNISDAASLSFTLDTIAPLAPTLALAHDTGVSNSDSLTNNPTITVTPAENGGTLLYKVDGASSFSATAPNFATDGSADGLHTVSVEQQDAAGNIGAATSLSFTLDTTAPAAPTVALLHDNGISATDHITNDPSFVFSTPALGDTFLYKEDSGSFSAVVPTFATDHSADGVHTVSVEEVDAAGNVSATTSLNFTLDTTPPHLTGITASPNSGNVFAGSTESFKFAFDEAVDVTGGTPTLTLNNGGTAVYDAVATAALHDATKLAFDYLVSSNDVPTTSLAVTGFIANGATVSDLAGNHADLTNVAATFATQINESSVPAYTIGGLTRPALELDSTGHIILDEAASSFAATYGIKSLYAGLPASTPYPPVADTHVTDFHLV